jgi:hypothetical protein
MAFVASYFDPGLDRAVWFVLSMRFSASAARQIRLPTA